MRTYLKTVLFFTLICVFVVFKSKAALVCPGGWRLYYQGQKCLRVFNYPRDYASARRDCQRNGGDLARVDDANKNKFISVLQKQYRALTWIGIHRVNHKFKWLDDTRAARFTYWNRGSPSREGAKQDCASLNGVSVRWVSQKCTEKMTFLCETDAFHDARLICPNGWSQYGNNCYRLFRYNKKWTDAEHYCQTQRGHLAHVQDKGTDQFLGRRFLGTGRDNVWIGLNDRVREGVYKWNDNNQLLGKYKNWGSHQPNNYQGIQDCVHYWALNGKTWADSQCTIRFHFICQRRAKNTDIHCDSGWDLNLQYKTCVKSFQYSASWNQARTNCKRMKADLVKIPDATFNKYVLGRLGQLNRWFWTGLHEMKNSQSLRWLDDLKAPKYKNIGGGRVKGKQNCAVVAKNSGRWKEWDCNSRNFYICQKATFASISCPVGYSVYKRTRKCYRRSNDILAWEKARESCQKDGADLVTITRSDLMSWLNSWLIARNKAPYWIGLHDRQKENDFHWLDTTNKVGFKFWARNQPDDKNGLKNCVYMNGVSKGNWFDAPCLTPRKYICQIAATINGRTPHIKKPPLMCPLGWSKYALTNTCIKFNTDLKNWNDARKACKKQGADLVKITEQKFNLFVNNVLKKTGTTLEPYIGLSDIAKKGSYRWLDEKINTKYTYWHSGEPSHGAEDCVVIITANGYNYEWNDVRCTYLKPYICQQPALPPGSVNCGPNWEDSPNSDYCYRFFSQSLTWLDARGSCQLNGGDLLSVVNSDEMLFLSGRLHTATGDKLWTGGNDKAIERGWTWSDGKPFAFFNWQAGIPSRNHSENCIALKKSTGRWSMESCMSHMPYICKKLGNVINHPTPPPTVSPAHLPKNKVWGCPHNWHSYRGSCYIVYHSTSGFTWQQANKACVKRNSNLAAITDYRENKYVYSLLPRHSSAAWIGLNAIKKKFSFTWSDGVTPVTYTNWNTGEPNHASTFELCVHMIRGGLWDDKNCRHLHHYMVCKQNKKIRDKSASQAFKGCNKGGVGYLNKCYVFYSTQKSFAGGQKLCKAIGGNLVTSNDRYVQAFLTSELSSLRAYNFWIGLSNTKKSYPENIYRYTWTTGEKLTFTNWDRNHTGAETKTCVAMKVAMPTGLWHNYPCTTKLNVICEYTRPGFTTPKPISTVESLLPCPSGWVGIGHMCYKIFFTYSSSNKKSWMDAQSACKSLAMGGNLASVTSTGLSKRLATEIGKVHYYQADYWIGLSDRDVEGGYKWMDGQPFITTNWASGQPDNNRNREDCVKLTAKYSHASWYDTNCYGLNNYICQAPRGAQIFTTLTPPTVGPTALNCGKQGTWTVYNGNCYYLSAYSLRNWYSARGKCHSYGAELVTIANADENNFITALMGKYKARYAWIGLNDLSDEYRWADGTAAYFFSWLPNQPNDATGGQRCVLIETDGGWNDGNCNSNQQFICKRKPGNISPITMGTITPPVGGCPNKFQAVPGTSTCYYVGGVNPADRKSFTDAAKACKAVLPKSRLASIHSFLDEDLIMTLTAGLNIPAWVGLIASGYYSSDYQWVDNTQRNYADWAPHEPHYVHYYQRSQKCVDLMIKPKNGGEWMNADCNSQLAYICEYRKNKAFGPNQPNTQGCITGYQRFRNSCYKYVDTLQTWSQSEATCAKDGGHLVSIQDRFETALLEVLIYPMDQSLIWIGLSDISHKNSYTWSDGWPVFQTFWDQLQPDLSKKCVAHKQNSAWNTQDCQTYLPSVCEIDKDPLPVPTPPGPGKCPSTVWTQIGAHCYFLETQQLKSWPEAKYQCGTLGGQLASAHSPSDAKIIFMLIRVEQVDVWIGLHKSGSGGFQWSDKSGVEFFNWADGSPSVSNDTTHQDCVVAQGVDGNWTDMNCFKKHGYLCKVKQVPVVTTTTIATTPSTITPKSTARKRKPASSKPATWGPGTWGPGTWGPGTWGPASGKPAKPTSTAASLIFPGGGVTQQKQNAPKQQSQKSGGLSGGGVAGIVIGVLLVIAIAGIGVFFMRKRMTSGTAGGFENAAYDVGRNENSGVQFSSTA